MTTDDVLMLRKAIKFYIDEVNEKKQLITILNIIIKKAQEEGV